MTDNDIIKALEICEKLCFFGGQRAGRELWFDKPIDVQNKDIANFIIDVTYLKDFINYQNAEIERLKWELDSTLKLLAAKREEEQREHNSIIKELETIKSEIPDTLIRIKAEAIKEFAERYKEEIKKEYEGIPYHDLYVEAINRLVKEMTEGSNG